MIINDELRQQWEERKETIRARFDITAYAQQHFGGVLKLVNRSKNEYRLTGNGHGGFVINEDDKTWYIHANKLGGDVFALIAYSRYGDTDTGSHRFRELMQIAADHTGVDLPEYTRQKRQPATTSPKRSNATYTYVDEDGKPLHRTQRYYKAGEKRFAQEYYDLASDTWQKQAAPDQRYVLYHLPDVLQAIAEKRTIFLVEGEHDADMLRGHGMCATCMAMGAGKWREEYASQLAGAQLVLVPDNDKAGVDGAIRNADRLLHHAASVKVVYLPDVTRRGQDVSDWLNIPGASIEALQRLAETTPEHQPAPAPQTTASGRISRQRTAMTQEAYRGTDTAMGMRLVHMHGDHVRWLPRSKMWIVWNGKYWQEDTSGSLQRMAVSVIRDLDDEAQQEPNTDRRNALRKMAIKAESMARRNAMIEAAKSEEGISMLEDQLEPANHLLNTTSGIVDLRTGQLQDHAPGHYQTNIVDIEYQPGSACVRWLQFLDEVFSGDQALIDYTQMAMGYMLTGEIKQEQFWFLYGTGKNGKSTFLEVLAALAGSYATTIPVNVIMGHERAGVPYELADMAGKRVVITSELPKAKRMSTEVVKAITSKDQINAQRKYGQPFTFTPTHKLIMAGNHKPIIRDASHGIWRRLALVPFNQNFEGREDRQLEDTLRNELPGILAWAVEGATKWYANSRALIEPPVITSARADYREEEDELADYIAQCCITVPGIITKHASLYETYKAWALANGHNVLSSNRFGRELEERGFTRVALAGNVRGRAGIGLRVRPEDDDDPTPDPDDSPPETSADFQPASEASSPLAHEHTHEHTNGHAPALTATEQAKATEHAQRGDLFVAADETCQHWHLVDGDGYTVIGRSFANEEAAWLALSAIGLQQSQE